MLKLAILFWTLGFFLLGMGVGGHICRQSGIKHDGSTGPGYAPYADKAAP
jgi:hypothetical protein